MKKLLFCLQTMVLGGVETELITVLKQFDKSKYDITLLLLYEQDNEILKRIPEGVKLVNLSIDKRYYCSGFSDLLKTRIKRGELFSATCLAARRLISPTGANVNIGKIPIIEDEFDYAVCYHMHSPIMLRYVADKVKAKRKIAWIHNDFATTGYKINKYQKWLLRYDRIAAVSIRLLEEFAQCCPHLAERAMVVNNIVDEESILLKSNDKEELDIAYAEQKKARLLTVGRFVEQKGFDIAIKTAKILRDRGLDFVWYVIGYGNEEQSMRDLIQEYNLSDNFVILGRKNNPYVYMAECDLYVQPSRHEGYPITMCEAIVLKKPIISTDFAGARELVHNGINGFVTDGFTPESVAAVIEKLFTDNELFERVTNGALNAQTGADWERIESLFTEE